MSRKECEDIIIGMMQLIRDVYRAYNPDGNYLSLSITENISVNNSYYDVDKDKPINVTLFPDGEIGRGYLGEDGKTYTEYEGGKNNA